MRFRKQNPQDVPAENVDAETAPDDTTPEEFPDISAGLAVLSKYQSLNGPRPMERKANKRGTWSDFD